MIMYMRPAISLEDKAIQKLMFEPAVDSSKIKISCKNGKVFLFGSVSSFFEKTVAERAVRSIQGVKDVTNELQIDLAEKYKRTDAEIANAAINALKWDVAVPEDAIQVSVENGQVTLTGKVDWWYQKNSAEKSIRNITGVKSIRNKISIYSTPITKNIKNKIYQEFHRNATINAEKIDIKIIGSKVILKGSVCSWLEIKEATRAAFSVPGVTQVDNRLTISD